MKAKKLHITIPELKLLLDYNEINGELRWGAVPPRFRRTGALIGRIVRSGYLQVMVGRVAYSGHRLAWAIYYGEDPSGVIDHINGDRADNRINNLRIGTNRDNSINRIEHRNGHVPGTSKERGIEKWRARIKINGRTNIIGWYDSPEEAGEAYMSVKRRLEGAGKETTHG